VVRVTVVGSLNMDLVVRAPHLPRPGETVLGGPFATFAGGKGSNQAVAAARLGAAVTMIGAIGGDDFGRTLRAGVQDSGVDARLEVVRAPTGIAVITIDGNGENTIVVAPGANALLGEAFVGSQRDAFAGNVVALQLEVPLPIVTAAARLGRAAGACVVLNAAPARPLPAELLALVDVLVLNREEAVQLAGSGRGASAEGLARALLAQGPRQVVVTLGADGAFAVDAARTVRQPGFRVDAIDTVAAGDAFVAALAVALAEGKDLTAALAFGCAAGALATTVCGAQPSLPMRAQVEELLRQRG
jgi:ribokinase